MSREIFQKVREKDAAVLGCIENGENDIQLITSATTLSNSEVNYSFRKLENLELIEVEKPEGTVDRVVNGTRQVFEAPKQAVLTELGERYLHQAETDAENYHSLDKEDLTEKVRELETQVEDLQTQLKMFQSQVQEKL